MCTKSSLVCLLLFSIKTPELVVCRCTRVLNYNILRYRYVEFTNCNIPFSFYNILFLCTIYTKFTYDWNFKDMDKHGFLVELERKSTCSKYVVDILWCKHVSAYTLYSRVFSSRKLRYNSIRLLMGKCSVDPTLNKRIASRGERERERERCGIWWFYIHIIFATTRYFCICHMSFPSDDI
jgi:hypothetical protein